MLTELRIENFAIIEKLSLDLSAGLLIFTGETGAGKSILMDALEMLLGGRAEAASLRAGAERASVEGIFRLNGAAGQAVRQILQREDLLDDETYLTLAREVRREGRSTARVNGRAVNIALMKELGALLVDIHGQTEHLSLLDWRTHLSLLDQYAALAPQLEDYRRAYNALQSLRRELRSLRAAQADAARRTEMLTFQAQEIEEAHLKPGEDETLRQERDRLANAESLAANAQEALTLLDEGSPETPAVTDLLGQAAAALSSLARTDSSQNELSLRADNLLESVSDLSRDLRRYLEHIEFNPKRLEQVEERLDLLYRLQRKYGGSLKAVLEAGEKARQELETLNSAEEKLTELETREAVLLAEAASRAQALSARRQKAAKALAEGIEAGLRELKMEAARFSVDFQTRPDPNGLPLPEGQTLAFDSSGLDRVEFLVAPNPGEGFKPLAKIASGGETSRLMLALKNSLAQADPVPTLVFDEIDQGIGGRVGGIVGKKLWQLGRSHQVLCITHLPQLAAFGGQHFQVKKQIHNERTTTQVTPLQGDERLLELAQMLGEVSEGTLRSASDLLQSAQNQSAA